MTALERRIGGLEGNLLCWKVYFLVSAYMGQQMREDEARRRVAEEAAAEARAAAMALAEAKAKADAEAAAAHPPPAPPPAVASPTRMPVPVPKATTPLPQPYDVPEAMQIRPTRWRPSEPYDDPDDWRGRVRHEYDPLAEEDDYYFEDS